MKVLVVDDIVENRYLLEKILNSGGYETLAASDGVEALERLDKEAVDLIISDVLMPRMDGFRLCRQIKRNGHAGIPFVFYTSAYTDRKDEEFALRLGAEHFFVKPVEPTHLLDVVGRLTTEGEGDVPHGREEIEGEQDYLLSHNDRLREQLEKKMGQVQDANDDLAAKVRHLDCLNNLASFGNRHGLTVEEVFEDAVIVIHSALPEPQSAGLRITYNGQEYISGHFADLPGNIVNEIEVNGPSSGTIEVCFLFGERKENSEIAAADEEKLLSSVAASLGRIAAGIEDRQELGWELEVNKAIAGLSNLLISSPATIEEVGMRVLETAFELTGSTYGYVSSVDPRTGDNVGLAVHSVGAGLCRAGEKGGELVLPLGPDGTYPGLWGHSLNTKKGYYTNNPAGHPAAREGWDSNQLFRNCLSVPAMISLNLVGQITLANKKGHYLDRELDAVERLADLFALALQRRRSEEALVEGEERLRATIEAIGDGVTIQDADHHIIWANRVARDRYGDLTGKKCHEAFRDRTEPCEGCSTGNCFADGKVNSHEKELKLADGKTGHFLVTSSPMLNRDGSVSAIVQTFKDVTEYRSLEEQFRQAQKMEAVGRLAGGVAHDFNNLMTAVIGNAEVYLMKYGEEVEGGKYLHAILETAERASRLTRQLLTFSRNQIIEPTEIDMNEALSSMGKLLERLLGEDITTAFIPDEDLWPVKADQSQMEQVILNLVVNARDAMPEGGKLAMATANRLLDEEFCRLNAEMEPGEYVEMSVADTGIGMDVETVGHVFEPFYTTKKEGTGLGLSTVYGIVRQVGGHITVDSEPGCGTVFKVLLPRIPEGEENDPEERGDEDMAELRGDEKVLLVEDNGTVSGLVGKILVNLGYEVFTAASGEEAVKTLEAVEKGIDVLLTDVVLPDRRGPQVAAEICGVNPGIKVLYMSGYDADMVEREGFVPNRETFISKPFKAADLGRKIRKLIDKANN